MSAHRGGRRGRRGGHGGGHENEERWLLTYSDMITLLMALFMVLFSISSVNTSKYTELQKSLQDAFSGKILTGGKAIENSGSDGKSPSDQATAAIVPIKPQDGQTRTNSNKAKEDKEVNRSKAQLDAYAAN